MPVWYTRCHLEYSDGIPFCHMEYDAKYGGRFLDVPGHPEPACEII